jgi:hypothetical protein
MTTKTTKKTAERPVLVCTAHRGVFFGYASSTRGDQIDLRRARNVVYWPQSNRGFVGLASMGPQPGAKVGPAADMDLRAVTCVLEVTPEAVVQFEKGLWS